jgi:hypothetical protein
MSPNSLRVLAGAAAAVFTLLTAIAVGFVGGPSDCAELPAPGASTPVTSASATAATSTPASAGPGGSFGNVPGRSAPPGEQPPPAEQPPPRPRIVVDLRCDEGSFAPTAAMTALVGTGLTAAVVLALMFMAALRRPTPAGGGPTVPAGAAAAGRPAAPVSAGRVEPRLDADRAALVRACIYVRDRVTSRALSDRLAAALGDAGVTVVEPVGDRFDPARHEAGGATPAADPALTGTIAAVEVPGYVDRGGRVLRAPVVTVYQGGPAGAGPSTTQSTRTQQTRRRAEEDR